MFDLVSGASIKLAWPLLHGRASLPLVAMADPWLIAICATGAGALWVFRRRAFTVATMVVAAIATFLTLKGVLMAIAVPQWRDGHERRHHRPSCRGSVVELTDGVGRSSIARRMRFASGA